jgi:putative transposase
VPWRESSFMSERSAFIKACLDRTERVTEICDRFGIGEKTGQKWLKRFREEGPAGLADRSRARVVQPHRITPEVAERIVALRRKYPLYGPARLCDWLRLHEPGEHWPAASSIGELLKRMHLIHSGRRRHAGEERKVLDGTRTRALEPNMVWTADFKGQFRLKTGSGAYCYPLTVLDLHTRYLLGCTALQTTSVGQTRRVFVQLFREYGLPVALRTDNGVPFAQPTPTGSLPTSGGVANLDTTPNILPDHQPDDGNCCLASSPLCRFTAHPSTGLYRGGAGIKERPRTSDLCFWDLASLIFEVDFSIRARRAAPLSQQPSRRRLPRFVQLRLR